MNEEMDNGTLRQLLRSAMCRLKILGLVTHHSPCGHSKKSMNLLLLNLIKDFFFIKFELFRREIIHNVFKDVSSIGI